MNAITVPKNPPTAMMGIRTSIGSSRRRSFTRSDPLALAVLREQPFGEVHALGELRHLTPHGLELLIERILLFRELGAQIAATGRGALAADPVGHRAADRREGHRDARAAPEMRMTVRMSSIPVSAAARAAGRPAPWRGAAR